MHVQFPFTDFEMLSLKEKKELDKTPNMTYISPIETQELMISAGWKIKVTLIFWFDSFSKGQLNPNKVIKICFIYQRMDVFQGTKFLSNSVHQKIFWNTTSSTWYYFYTTSPHTHLLHVLGVLKFNIVLLGPLRTSKNFSKKAGEGEGGVEEKQLKRFLACFAHMVF